MTKSKGRILAASVATIAVLCAVAGFLFYRQTQRSIPVTYTDPFERFKYGSLGTEGFGLPTYVFEVLPEICPEKFPGGYEAQGWIFEEGKSIPIGLSQRDMGVMRVGFNCATCHVGSYRETKETKPKMVLGMPPQRLDFRLFLEKMGECVLDARFTADAVMEKVEARHQMSLLDRTVYRYVAIPKVIDMTTYQTERHAFFSKRPQFGPGRFDALNFIRLDLEFNPGQDDAVGVVDYPSVWNQKARQQHYAQWDGSTPSVSERNRLAAMLAAGGDLEALDEDEMSWHDVWLLTLPVPVYPFPVNEELARKGEPLFQQHCADCHIEGGKRVGLPMPVQEIGTDPNRTDNLTPELGAALNKLKTARWEIKQFRKTGGYASVLLDGVWARAPYLHNGSVPNLRELLEKPELRSKVFYRGYDVYDPEKLGFISSGPDAEKEGWKFDTSVKGNSNSGHLYGTDLSAEDKVALIEYVKLRDKNVVQP
jgi:hypothetical protein